MNLSPLAFLIDLLPAKARKVIYGIVATLGAVVAVLIATPSVHLPAWVALVSSTISAVTGLLAVANTNVKTK